MAGKKIAGILLMISGVLLVLSIIAQIPGLVYFSRMNNGFSRQFIGLAFFETGIGIAAILLIRYGLKMIKG